MDNKFNCPHCSKERMPEDRFCSRCGEPFDIEVADKEQDKRFDYQNAMFFLFLKYEGIMAITSLFVAALFFFCSYDVGAFPFFRCFFGILFLLTIIPICVVWLRMSNKRQRIIDEQFVSDQTSICPVCGGHDISLGRKGYDWNKGFWYSIFKVRGGHYLAGMDGRRVTAYCNKCGHKWETDRAWIK